MKREAMTTKQAPVKTQEYIHTASCLQCKPCGSGCTIMDNRISFVFDPDRRCVSGLRFDPAPIACMGRCGKACQEALSLVQEIKKRLIQVE